jgi:hypothetical protein
MTDEFITVDSRSALQIHVYVNVLNVDVRDRIHQLA